MADEEERSDSEEAKPSTAQKEGDEGYAVADLSMEEEVTEAAFDLNTGGGSPQRLGEAGHSSEAVSDEALGHLAPMSVLVGVLAALILLTILTVGVTAVDLGAQGNFAVAMAIATVKAVLVMGYFMHLFWDSKFNIVIFGSSFLFAALFLAMAFLDSQETQSARSAWEVDQAQLAQE